MADAVLEDEGVHQRLRGSGGIAVRETDPGFGGERPADHAETGELRKQRRRRDLFPGIGERFCVAASHQVERLACNADPGPLGGKRADAFRWRGDRGSRLHDVGLVHDVGGSHILLVPVVACGFDAGPLKNRLRRLGPLCGARKADRDEEREG